MSSLKRASGKTGCLFYARFPRPATVPVAPIAQHVSLSTFVMLLSTNAHNAI